jgi:hypothetical protein
MTQTAEAGSPVHGAFREAVLGPPLRAGTMGGYPNHSEPRSRGFAEFGFSVLLNTRISLFMRAHLSRLKPNGERPR